MGRFAPSEDKAEQGEWPRVGEPRNVAVIRRSCGARRKGSRGNQQAGLILSPPGANPRLSSLWMLELRVLFLTWGLEYAHSRGSELGHDSR